MPIYATSGELHFAIGMRARHTCRREYGIPQELPIVHGPACLLARYETADCRADTVGADEERGRELEGRALLTRCKGTP